MEDSIVPTLRKVGLTEGEIRVYLSLVRLGSVTVGPVIDKARISSSKVYIVLEKLVQKGLVSYILKEKTRYFQANQPIALLDYVAIKERELQEERESLRQVISQIETLQSTDKPEEARIYKGYEGMKTGIFEAIKTIPEKGYFYFFSAGYGQEPYLKNFFRRLVLELKRKKIQIKGIVSIEQKELYDSYYKRLGGQVKFSKHYWPSDLSIVGDYVMILVWDKKEPTVYLIRSKVLVNSYLAFFNEEWGRK
jgi:sugar-specific transcriptional regulator TrmB